MQPHAKRSPGQKVSVKLGQVNFSICLKKTVEHKINAIRIHVHSVYENFRKKLVSDNGEMQHRTFGQFEVRREEGVSAAGCFAPPIVIYTTVRAWEGLKRGTRPGFLSFSLSLSFSLCIELREQSCQQRIQFYET
jgi:hypothetical protein